MGMLSSIVIIFSLLISLLSLQLSDAQFITGKEKGRFKQGGGALSFDGGMAAEINALSGKTLQFDGIDGSRIKDATLRRHMKNFLSKPITMKFTTSSSKTPTYFKAIVKTSKGERLRGYWRQNKESGTFDRSKLLEMSYEEALKRKGGTPVECEVQLPPIKGHKPFVVYSIVLGRGSSSATACAIKSIGSVALLPKGREGKNYPLGKSLITFPLKGGIVDSGWAKGRTIFRSGRTMGKL